MFLIDSHLDLSMNALEWNRNLRLSTQLINQMESHLTDKPDRGKALVSFPELRKGNIGLVVATQIARYSPGNNILPGWNSPEQAWAQTQGQLAWYQTMVDQGELFQILDRKGFENHLNSWNNPSSLNPSPIGFILSLEGADSLVNIQYLEKAYAYGLRALGPAHYGTGRYANGTDSEGKLSLMGKELLREMDQLGIILDVTHLCDESFWDALDIFKGPIWASHQNCRKIVPHNRQFSDEQFKALIERNAYIGLALDAWMMVPNWEKGKSNPRLMDCNLEKVLDHLDHICQLAGNANHVGIGSDLDGAFGKEQAPYDLDSIADLQKFETILRNRGYSEKDILGIGAENFIRFVRNIWPNEG